VATVDRDNPKPATPTSPRAEFVLDAIEPIRLQGMGREWRETNRCEANPAPGRLSATASGGMESRAGPRFLSVRESEAYEDCFAAIVRNQHVAKRWTVEPAHPWQILLDHRRRFLFGNGGGISTPVS